MILHILYHVSYFQHIYEELCGLKFRISPDSFFQGIYSGWFFSCAAVSSLLQALYTSLLSIVKASLDVIRHCQCVNYRLTSAHLKLLFSKKMGKHTFCYVIVMRIYL